MARWRYCEYDANKSHWTDDDIVTEKVPALAIYSAYFELDILHRKDGIQIIQRYAPQHTYALAYKYSYQYIGNT